MDLVPALRSHAPLTHAFILVLLFLPYGINLGASSLWDASESYYAETPREMIESGDYLAPRFNYQQRSQKPPLTYWVIVLSYKIFGVSEFAVRLPSALAAAGILLFTYGIGILLFNPRVGLAAALVLGTTPRFFALARRLPIDMLLLFWLTGAAFFLVHAIKRDSTKSWIFFYVFVGLGFMTKGPVALVVPAAAYLLWALWTRRTSLRTARPLLGLLILTATIAPWYLLIYRLHGWDYIAAFFLRDNLGRFATQTLGPSRGPFYYVSVFAADFFPWSLLCPAAFYHLWTQTRRRGAIRDTGWSLPLVWCAVIFLLFSLSRNKQEYYIAPMYPLMAVVLAAAFDEAIMGAGALARSLVLWKWGLVSVSLVLVALSAALLMLAPTFLPSSPPLMHYVPSLLLFLGFAALAWNALRSKITAAFWSLLIPLFGVFLAASLVYLPALEPMRPVKALCESIKLRSDSHDEVGYYGASIPSMVFYLRRPIFEEFRAEEMTKRFQGERRVFCILTREDFDYFVNERNLALHVIERRPRLPMQLNALIDEQIRMQQEVILASNMPPAEQE